MNVGIALVEPSLATGSGGTWLTHGSSLAVVGADAFDDVVQWVSDAGLTHVIVTARAAAARQARLLGTVLVGAEPRTAVAVRPVDTTSVALAAAASAALEGDVDPIRGLEIFGHLAETSVAGVWLRSVTRLEHPKPSLGRHLQSLVGRGFVASITPVPEVVRARSAVAPDTDLLVGADADSEPFLALTALGPADRVHPVPGLADVRTVYGSPGAEFVALARVPGPSPTSSSCSVCGLAQAGAVCPFCHVRLRVPERT